MRVWWLTPALLASLGLSAQEIDTGNFGHSRLRGSIPDRAESGAERKDYLELQKARDPAERRELAAGFLSHYPKSSLTGAAYRISAAASLDLKDYPRALAEGRIALRFLPEDAALLAALAHVELALGKAEDARRDAADALLWLSVFSSPAGVKPSQWDRTRRELEDYARSAIERAGGKPPLPLFQDRERRKAKGEKFAGSAACRKCHAAIYESWRSTGMANMLRPARQARVLADFTNVQEFRDSAGRVKARMGGGGDHPYFEFAVAGQGWKRFRVDYAIGSKWQQAYATRLADERLFVFPIQFNVLQKSWLNYWATIDPPGSERAATDRFPELSDATSYQRNCAVCHTSQLRLIRLDDASMQRAMFREPGINCEMCHGPSARHASAIESGQPDAEVEGGPPFRFARLDHREATLICGQCHRQSALRDLGSNGEMNYRTEKPYFTPLLNQPYSEFGSRAFYKDGRFRETTFIGEAFMRSACFRRGTAQCASCHNPHPPDASGNRVSLKFRSDPDRMCLQCHPQMEGRVAAHTHHPAESAASRCAACHMPPIMNSLLFRAASHQIDDIPRADLTARFGPEESPNACLLCHKDKTAQWVTGQLLAW